MQQQILARLVKSLDLPDSVALDINDRISRRGPIRALSEVELLDAQTRAILAPHVSLLPQPGDVNINTASEAVIAAVLGSPTAARQLVKRREQNGFLTRGDVTDAGIVALNGIGFTSDVYDVESRAEVDGTTVILTSRLLREDRLGQKDTYAIERSFSAHLAAKGALPVPTPFRP